jgi:hypothetical protein
MLIVYSRKGSMFNTALGKSLVWISPKDIGRRLSMRAEVMQAHECCTDSQRRGFWSSVSVC